MESAVGKTHGQGLGKRQAKANLLVSSSSQAPWHHAKVPGWPTYETKPVTATEEETDIQNQSKGRA